MLAQAALQLVKPLVDDSNQYSALSLKRSKAANGTKRVIGVLGVGHLQEAHLKMTTDNAILRFRDLVRPTPKSWHARKPV